MKLKINTEEWSDIQEAVFQAWKRLRETGSRITVAMSAYELVDHFSPASHRRPYRLGGGILTQNTRINM
jgi:pimeloyl-CoA synthetase